jgi:hypothetical protein
MNNTLTINQALDNFNTFKGRYEKGSVSLIAAGVVVCSTYTNEKDAKKALQDLFDTTSSSEAEMRDAAIRLYSFHKNDTIAIINGEKTASAATNALTDYVLSFAADSGAIYGKDEHNRRLLLPKLEHFRKAPKVEAMQEVQSSDVSQSSENSEKSKEPNKAKSALQLMQEAVATMQRSLTVIDDTSLAAHEFFAELVVAMVQDDSADLSSDLKHMKSAYDAGVNSLINKGRVNQAA